MALFVINHHNILSHASHACTLEGLQRSMAWSLDLFKENEMSSASEPSRTLVSTQRDTEIAPVAVRQGKQKWHVWYLTWTGKDAV